MKDIVGKGIMNKPGTLIGYLIRQFNPLNNTNLHLKEKDSRGRAWCLES